MKKFSDKRGSKKKKKKIKSFEKLFNFICFLESSDGGGGGGNGCSDLLCYGAVFGGGWRFGGLRWIDTGSEFGLCYLCWIFLFAVFWWVLLYFLSTD